ncbi:MAG: hypothetical protein MUF77_12715 [Leptospira sp.]|jgi:hypothetical protein|nr:hypothetical protein [Leptospira sp.]
MNILQPNREITLTSQGKTWIAEIATPRMNIDIDLAVARRLGGVSLESIPGATYGYILACKTLEVVLRVVPDEYKKYRAVEDYPEPDLVAELIKQYEEKSASFREELKKNRDQGIHSKESRNNSGSLHDTKVSHPSKRNKKHRRHVRRAEEFSSGGERDSGGFQSVLRDTTGNNGDSRDRESRSTNSNSSENTAYASGRGRIYPS